MNEALKEWIICMPSNPNLFVKFVNMKSQIQTYTPNLSYKSKSKSNPNIKYKSGSKSKYRIQIQFQIQMAKSWRQIQIYLKICCIPRSHCKTGAKLEFYGTNFRVSRIPFVPSRRIVNCPESRLSCPEKSWTVPNPVCPVPKNFELPREIPFVPLIKRNMSLYARWQHI